MFDRNKTVAIFGYNRWHLNRLSGSKGVKDAPERIRAFLESYLPKLKKEGYENVLLTGELGTSPIVADVAKKVGLEVTLVYPTEGRKKDVAWEVRYLTEKEAEEAQLVKDMLDTDNVYISFSEDSAPNDGFEEWRVRLGDMFSLSSTVVSLASSPQRTEFSSQSEKVPDLAREAGLSVVRFDPITNQTEGGANTSAYQYLR